MGAHLYWISAITYAFVLGVVLVSDIRATEKPDVLEKSYRTMSIWVIFFCLQDCVWGLCESRVINNDTFFFISSSVFHLSTVITTFFWLKYVLDYLADKIRFKKIYLILDIIVVGFEVVLVIINFFNTTLFEIVDGEYITGHLRVATFINQYEVYLVIGITTLVFLLKKEKTNTAHYRTVFLFTLAPILLGVCQLLYPDAPFYSLGYFLGCIIVHIFVIRDKRDIFLSQEEKFKKIIELNKELEKKQTEIDGQLSILKSMAGAYDYINLVDLESQTAHRFGEKDSLEGSFDLVNDPHTALNKKIAPRIIPEQYDRFWDYTNLSLLNERMKGKKLIVAEFKYADGNSFRALYIRIGDNVNAPIKRVAYALRDITIDRKREEQVYSALTHLVYSLHIFDLENDTMERMIESDIFKKIVGDEVSAQKMSYTIIKGSCKEEYLDIMLDFVNLSTVNERMKGKDSLTIEFVGKFHGWTRMTFVPTEMNKDKIKKMAVITEIIDSEKTEMMNLIYKSSTDELTRLYNRRTYEDDLDNITNNTDMDKLVIVAMDVNGLKTVNDTVGHKAGDELIIGASKCIDSSFKLVGKAYRTGGDEFMAILKCDEEKLPDIFAAFESSIREWTGNLVKSLSISYGYVLAKDFPELNVRDLASEADKKMYEAKSEYYRRNGIERRRT